MTATTHVRENRMSLDLLIRAFQISQMIRVVTDLGIPTRSPLMVVATFMN
jgi:hypothetical protein